MIKAEEMAEPLRKEFQVHLGVRLLRHSFAGAHRITSQPSGHGEDFPNLAMGLGPVRVGTWKSTGLSLRPHLALAGPDGLDRARSLGSGVAPTSMRDRICALVSEMQFFGEIGVDGSERHRSSLNPNPPKDGLWDSP